MNIHAEKIQDPQRRRLSKTAHTDHPWRIHEVAGDFILEDVWYLPTPGGPDNFHLLVSMFTSGRRPEEGASPVGRLLWTIRWKLGEWLGWDRKGKSQGIHMASLLQRIPANLSNTDIPKKKDGLFIPLYFIHDEYAAEIINRTVHGVLHLGWVKESYGGYRGQMAVLVKPNGLFGKIYMALIKPFRYLFIYPALLRRFEREWSQMQKR